MIKELVSNQISPNLTFSDAFRGLSRIFNVLKKENLDFSPFFNTDNYLLTNAARTALAQIIEVIKPPKGKKIGIPAFICAAVVTPFLEKGYEICWIDTDENGVIGLEDYKKKSDNISVVVVPHIFGKEAPLAEIYKHAKAKNIFVIEDGAHLFDTDTTHCDAKIFSFGREKVFSCVSGGALVWGEDSPYAEQFKNIQLSLPKASWTIRHLLQPLILSISIPLWNMLSIGKGMAYLTRKTNLLPLAVTQKEKEGYEDFPQASLPYPLQCILLHQLENAWKIHVHRKKVALAWKEVLPKLFPKDEIIVPENHFRVILKTSGQKDILNKAKKIGFELREWDGVPISPAGVDLKNFGYGLGDCPNAESFAQNYVTFPTNVRTSVKKVFILLQYTTPYVNIIYFCAIF